MAVPARTLRSRNAAAAGQTVGGRGARVGTRADNVTRPKPDLAVVPRRRRRTAGVIVTLSLVLGGAMIGAVAVQIELAERQLDLDRLDRELRVAMQQYESLRRERAELLAPDRLALIAESSSMRPSVDGDFVVISPDIDVAVQQSTGSIDQGPALFGDGLLEEYRAIKGLVRGAP